MLGYAAYADRFAGDLDGRARVGRLPARARRDVPAPHAAAAAARRRQRRRVRRGRLPHRPRRPRHAWPTCARWPPTCGARASASCSTSCSTTSRASTSGPPGRGPASSATASTSTSTPPARCPTRTSGRCRRCSPTSRRAASPGTTTSTAGCGPRSTRGSGTWTGRTRRCSPSSRTSCCTWPTRASRCSGSTPSRSCGSGWAPSCQNEPEVHAITQALRAVARIACPAVVFKAEAIVGPADLVHYLGTGRHHGKVSDLAYHNGLMVHVWSMLAAKDATLASHALRALPPIPSTTAWVTYVRCHDDIGWAIADEDAAAVGLDGYRHRHFLSDWYAGVVPGFRRPRPGVPGERRHRRPADQRHGREPGRARGGARGRRPGVDRRRRRPAAARPRRRARLGRRARRSGPATSWPCRTTRRWADEPGHGDDNRWAHRPRLDPAVAARRHDAGTVEARVFEGLRHLAPCRAALPHLHASVRERGARSRRPRRADGRPPAPARAAARCLQRDARLAPGARVAAARARRDAATR